MNTEVQKCLITPTDKVGLALLAQMHSRAFSAQREKPWTVDSFSSLLATSGLEALVYAVDEKPIGFSVVRSVLDEAELITVAVDPAFQGNGYARTILTEVIGDLRTVGVAHLFLEVRQDNKPAIGLYRSLGFKKIGVRKAYYQTIDGKKIDADIFSLGLG